MIVTLDLTDVEVEGLSSEKSGAESLEQVIRRLITPLVARSTKARFGALFTKFQAASPDKQAQVIAVLEKLTF